MSKRTSGILLHINSLPSRYGTGDLGPTAYKFADFLHSAGQSHWQMLPVSPPAVDIPHCPYSAISAFAGDPLLISPELLLQAAYLRRPDLANAPGMEKKYVDYRILIPWKTRLLTLAFQRFKSAGPEVSLPLLQAFTRQANPPGRIESSFIGSPNDVGSIVKSSRSAFSNPLFRVRLMQYNCGPRMSAAKPF